MRNKSRILLVALLLDVLLGEPPNRWHPVVWMGSFINTLRKRAPKQGQLAAFLYGGWITLGGISIVGTIATLVVRFSRKLPFPLNLLAQAWLLKTAFSLRGLNKAAIEVEAALRMDDLSKARRLLSWHLVSRDTSQLSQAQVAAAAIESVAENTSDGIVAPLLWYGVGGIPGALIYRYVNTADSLLGYHDAEREWLGKIPARTDDIVNIIPARFTALLLLALRPQGWKVWRRNAHKTASPNAGHPMSTMAGALDVELEKVAYYVLNGGAHLPDADDLWRARHLMVDVVSILVVLLAFSMRHKND